MILERYLEIYLKINHLWGIKMSKWVKDTIRVNNNDIPTEIGMLNQIDLSFYPENPRVYSIIYNDGTIPSQEEIQKKLASMDHVKQLVQSIKANGGLKEPLLVRKNMNIVLEGNSRLAAYRILTKKDPAKWSMVKCIVVPESITDTAIFAILGTYHIVGRKDWAPYEQAGYLYRRNKKQKTSTKKIAQELGLTENKIKHLIKVYDFMVTHNENDVNKWSYYDEYLKSQKIKIIRKESKELDKIVVKKIKKGEIEKAVDVRNKLPKIVSANKKTLKSFVDEKADFDKSYERALIQGADNTSYQRLQKFCTWIVDTNLKSSINDMPDNQKKKCVYELKKLEGNIKKILKKVETSQKK
jgi:hypothetical protein